MAVVLWDYLSRRTQYSALRSNALQKRNTVQQMAVVLLDYLSRRTQYSALRLIFFTASPHSSLERSVLQC
jgi:hypothetical protein